MDDRKLREYAINIYKGISGYTLNKAFSLFPKYYPKIAFYYAEILTKQQNEMSMRMIQALGIDKGRALLNELNELNAKIVKFYVNAEFKINQSYRRIEEATDEDRSNVVKKEIQSEIEIMTQSTHILRESTALLLKIKSEAKKYSFIGLENDVDEARNTSIIANEELIRLNFKFDNYIKQYET